MVVTLMHSADQRLPQWQRRIFLLCFGAYGIAYLGRMNLSVAMPFLQAQGFDKSSLGLVGSCFFWIYAFGQLINGRLGDRFPGRTFVFVGLLGSAVANLLFGLQSSLVFMLALWALNGFLQSILWGPLMRTLALWHAPLQRAGRALGVFSSAMLGYAIIWGGLGQLAPRIGWRPLFLIPGGLLFIYAFVWYLGQRTPEEVGVKAPGGLPSQNEAGSYVALLRSTPLARYALVGVFVGFVREGINLWMPTLLREVFGISASQTLVLAVIVSSLNLCGLLLARFFVAKIASRGALTALYTCGTLIGFLLWATQGGNMVVFGVLLALCSMFMYGATSILTSVIPQECPMPSTAAGFIDFVVYLGAGLSGIITGIVSERYQWTAVPALWVGALLLAGVGILLIHRRKESPVSMGEGKASVN